ncbi:UDP-N-acetylglucosamine 2-epimerase (non-hydrolyzing) [soil metagenome]
MKKIFTVVGARPQFVKLAPILAALRGRDQLQAVVVHTGQHFDPEMSDVFFAELGLPPPDHHLGIHGGSHGDMTGRMLAAIEDRIVFEKPAAVLVVGDTNSTLAGALAASKLHVPVAHVEAGLRSFNKAMPEEVNRVLTDHVSSLLFCPTRTAMENLARESVNTGVHHVGDVMFDAILMFRERAKKTSRILGRLGLIEQSYSVATLHRAENTDDPVRLGKLLDYLRQSAGGTVVLPLHPRTRQKISAFGLSTAGLTVIEPIGYLDMIQLVGASAGVMTDSGGLQKEAYFLGKPCVTLRGETEWTETIAHGWNRLWTVNDYAPRHPIADYGDGHASAAIVRILEQSLLSR